MWRPVTGGLLTKWAEEIDVNHVLPEYPRPQMVRERWLNLNGLWDYAITKDDAQYWPKDSEGEGKILVPFPLESALSGVKRALLPDELLWYRRAFSLPPEWAGQRVLLHFGAVDWRANVWVNGTHVGEHTGGYYPFSFDISEYLRAEVNELMVSVWDGTDAYGLERGKQILKPGGIFYTAVSGIWQTVWLEPVPQTYIKSHRITPDLDKERILVSLDHEGLVSASDSTLQFTAQVFDGTKEIARGSAAAGNTLELELENPKLWGPNSPFLYDVKIHLRSGEEIMDGVDSYFGMRKFSIGKDREGVERLLLNNQPLFLHGVLDQGYWPDGLYTAPSDEALEFDVALTKKLGFNMNRKHIKVEPARWYYHCDRLGVIVWQDMISGGRNVDIVLNGILPMVASGLRVRDNKYKQVGREDESSRDNFEKELKEMIDCLYNFPCISMWVPFNEAWGQYDAERIAAWVKDYNPRTL